MTKSPLVLIALAVLLLALVVPTGAAGGDQLWTSPDVVLAPGTGSGGAYASLNADGELEVDVTSPGVNPGAATTFAGVFTVENRESASVGVWFSHDETDDVVLAVDGRSVQREADALVLASGERASVDLSVDSSAFAAGDLVLSSFTVHAEAVSTSTGSTGSSTATVESAAGPAPSTGDVVTPTPDATAATTPGAEPTPTSPPSGGDQVVFADGTEPAASFTALDPTAVGSIDDRAGSPVGPRAVIDAAVGPRRVDGAVAAPAGTETVLGVGQTVSLSAHRTVFGSASAIQPDGRIARLVEVDVPADRADKPAIVRLAVPRDRLGGSDPTAARIGHHTGAGWQLLETRVVDADADRVVLEARTPGFSPFAVFPDPAVRYDWQLPAGRTTGAGSVETELRDPGRHTVNLTVTDGLGRSATTTYRVVVNDRPSVAIVAPATIESDRPVTLRANVTDRVGETTVTWRFDDGSRVVGPVVERTFTAGEHVVEVTVTDEYGGTASADTTLVVGTTARAGRPTVELVRLGSAAEGRLVVVATVGLLLLVAVRRGTGRPRRTRRRQSR